MSNKRVQARFNACTFLIPLALGLTICKKEAWSAACCARNSAIPALIVGDDQAQMNFGYTFGSVVAEADHRGGLTFGSPHVADISQSFRLEGGFLLSDRLQLGGSVSLVEHSITQVDLFDSAIGTGDTRFSLGYELLPVWSYSQWQPQIFGFLVFTLPTGRSKYEYESPLLADVTGNGFYSISIGGLLVKRWSAWDAFILSEIHYSFPRTFATSESDLQVIPGFGGSLGFGGGVSPWNGNLRLGLRIQPRLDQPTTTILAQKTSPGRGILSVCDTGFDASYLLSTNDSLMASYTDQSLLGYAMNLNVNRTFALNFQHRWER